MPGGGEGKNVGHLEANPLANKIVARDRFPGQAGLGPQDCPAYRIDFLPFSRLAMPAISKIVQALEPSATLAMAAKAKELKAAGRKVFDLSVGEPDFTTPDHICAAATAAMKAGHTHYTVASGIPELKAAVARSYERAHGLKYGPPPL